LWLLLCVGWMLLLLKLLRLVRLQIVHALSFRPVWAHSFLLLVGVVWLLWIVCLCCLCGCERLRLRCKCLVGLAARLAWHRPALSLCRRGRAFPLLTRGHEMRKGSSSSTTTSSRSKSNS